MYGMRFHRLLGGCQVVYMLTYQSVDCVLIPRAFGLTVNRNSCFSLTFVLVRP